MLGKFRGFFTGMLGKKYRYVGEENCNFHAQKRRFSGVEKIWKRILFRKYFRKEGLLRKNLAFGHKIMTNKKPTSHLLLLANEHSGRDEMNLAGHPFALLQSPKRQSETSIFYDWKRTVGGREVTASWRVETPAAFGLPGPEEELLYLVLLQLTREAAEAAGTPGNWPLQIKFSRSDVLKRMGWDDGSQRYVALNTAFSRLQAVSIFAKYAFYDARIKAPVDAVGFGIINEFSLVAEPKGRKSQGTLPLSHFEWNTVLHSSFLAGNVRSLSLDFAISLEHPTSRRLFRLLELLRYASKPPRPQLSIGVFKLRDRLGMTTYKYPSKIAEKLKPAIDELVRRGYIAGMSLEKDAFGATKAQFRFFDQLWPQDTRKISEAARDPLERPQTALSQQGLPDLPLFSALLPDWNAPSPADFDDPAAALLDAFFEALPPQEKDDIDARVYAALPIFLQDNSRTRGAILEMARGRRREVVARYPNALSGAVKGP